MSPIDWSRIACWLFGHLWECRPCGWACHLRECRRCKAYRPGCSAANPGGTGR